MPVVVRAFWEADWEIKGLDDERIKMAMYIDKEDKPRKGGEMMKPLRDSTLTLEILRKTLKFPLTSSTIFLLLLPTLHRWQLIS